MLFVSLALLVAVSYAVPVSVMLPLDVIGYNGAITDLSKLTSQLKALKGIGVDGVMTDVWWGLVEQQPKQYNWQGYLQLAALCQQVGLTLQVVTSFHQCGTNVGDSFVVPLPQWILSVGKRNTSIWYTDQTGAIDQEYISLGADALPIFEGRSPVQIYKDFMVAFRSTFAQYIPNVVNEIQVGMGPAGELRYPGYQLQFNRWSYCGVGAFQNYDANMLQSLKSAAYAAGHPEWSNGGPNSAGYYNSMPYSTPFFQDNNFDNYASPYGRFFLNWYANLLMQHGATILADARAVFGPKMSIAAKVSGIHWWYNSNNHGAELTSGYYNTNGNDAYLNLAKMFSRTNTTFCFTCLEMTDSQNCASSPVELVEQTILASKTARIGYSGENALELCSGSCNTYGFQQIINQASKVQHMHRFTYLRLTDSLTSSGNLQLFGNFVNSMHGLH